MKKSVDYMYKIILKTSTSLFVFINGQMIYLHVYPNTSTLFLT